ncbi:MAG: rhomboid family intramembrane serine protease [Candidatus Polarisedimenticolia bacterium]
MHGTRWEWRKRLGRRRLEEFLAGGARGTAAALLPPRRLTTIGLLTANVALFALILALRGVTEGRSLFGLFAPSGEALYVFGAKYTPAILAGEAWRLLTASYLHGGAVHLLFNCSALASLGPLIEEGFGSRRLFVIYTVTGIAAFVLSSWWRPETLSVGSSGSIFGLMGFAWVYGRYRGGAGGRIVADHLGRWLMFGLVMLFLPGIDNAAHLGGALSGGALGLWLRPGEPVTRASRIGLALATGALLLLTAASFAAMVAAQRATAHV